MSPAFWGSLWIKCCILLPVLAKGGPIECSSSRVVRKLFADDEEAAGLRDGVMDFEGFNAAPSSCSSDLLDVGCVCDVADVVAALKLSGSD